MPTTDPKKTVDMNKILRVYSGSSNRPLAEKIAGLLGVELSGLTLKQFANGEIYATAYDWSILQGSTLATMRPSAAPTCS